MVNSFSDFGEKIGPYGYINDTIPISFQKRITMPFDVREMHTLELYYKNEQFTVSQNYQLVETFTIKFGFQLGQIGGWFGANFLTPLVIHDIIFTTDSEPKKMQNWLKNYFAKNDVKISNKTYN